MDTLLCQVYFELVALQEWLHLENVEIVLDREALQAFGIIGLKS